MTLQRDSASPLLVTIGLGLVVAACNSDPLDPNNTGTTSSTVGVGGAGTTVTTAGVGGADTTVTTAGVGGAPGTTTATSTTSTASSTTSTGTGGVMNACAPISIPATDKLTSKRFFVKSAGANPEDESNWSTLAFDPAKGEMVMFGGRATHKQQNIPFDKVGTWSWSGSAWAQLAGAATSPSARTGFAMVHDKQRKQTLLFGGEGSSSGAQHLPLNDTWLWDGTAWHAAVVNGPLPPARSNYALSYDSDTATILLHGGVGAGLNVLSDTWRWDGSGWTNVTPSGPTPTARAFHGMAYDPIRKRTVLFGGSGWSGAPSVGYDVWEWDGAAWKNVGAPISPAPPGGANTELIFDPSRGMVLSYGGKDTSTSPAGEYYDFLAWNGVAWTRIYPVGVGVPPYSYNDDSSPNAHHWGLAYDDCRNRIVLFRHIPTFGGADVFEFETTGHLNHAPVFLNPVGPVQIYPGDTRSFQVEATDADLDTLSYSTSPLPTGANFYPLQPVNTAAFSWHPTAAQSGEYSVTITASDGTATTDMTVPIHVGDLTYAPLPTSTTVNVTLSGTSGLACSEINNNGSLEFVTAVPGVTTVCTLKGTNPGRVTALCTISVPSFVVPGRSVPYGSFQYTASGPVKGDMKFPVDNGQLSFTGYLKSGPSVNLSDIQIDQSNGKFTGSVLLN